MLAEKFFSNIASTLIIFFPVLLISGPFLSDFACILIGIIYIFFAAKRKNFEEFNNYLIFFLTLIFIYINFNSIFSFNPKISFGSSLPYIRIIFFILGLSFFLNKYEKLKLYFFYASFCCILFLFIDSTFQYLTGTNLLGMKLLHSSRISSVFGDELIMGSFVSRILPLLLGLTYLLNINKIAIIRFIIIILSGFLIIYSGERTAFAYYFIILLFYIFFNFNKKVIFGFLLFFSVIFAFFPTHHNTFLNRIFLHSVNQLNETESIIKFSYRHYLHYYTAHKMFLDKKFFGQGIKSFRYLCDNPKFSALNKIIEDNKIIAPTNSYVFYYHPKKRWPAAGVWAVTQSDSYVIFSKKNYRIDDGPGFPDEIEKFNINIRTVTNDETINSLEEKLKIKLFVIPGWDYILHKFVENGSYVNKGQSIISHYEFKNGCSTHPHSLYMQFLSELGILGLLFILISFVFSLYKLFTLCIKKLKKKISNVEIFETFIFLSIFITLFPLLPSGNFFNNWMLMITHLPLGFYLALSNNKN